MKALIVYYTLSGSTGIVSKEIKKHFNFHMWDVGIRRIKSKTNLLKLFLNTLLSRPIQIRHGRYNFDEYDVILVGTSALLGKPNAAILSFINSLVHIKDKKFICFSVSFFGQSKAVKILSDKITDKEGNVVGTYSFKTKNIKKNLQGEVEQFLDSLNILKISKKE